MSITKESRTSTSKQQHSFQGQLLVSMPGMTDSRFKNALIIICGHDENGAMGLVINKVIDNVFLKDIIAQMDLKSIKVIPDAPIHYGGPVESGRGFVLHSADHLHDASVPISKDVALTASTSLIQDVVAGEKPDQFRVVLGYAGWSSGQLEGEIMKNLWLNLPAESSVIFDPDTKTLWERTLQKYGINPHNLSMHAGHA